MRRLHSLGSEGREPIELRWIEVSFIPVSLWFQKSFAHDSDGAASASDEPQSPATFATLPSHVLHSSSRTVTNRDSADALTSLVREHPFSMPTHPFLSAFAVAERAASGLVVTRGLVGSGSGAAREVRGADVSVDVLCDCKQRRRHAGHVESVIPGSPSAVSKLLVGVATFERGF
jgi:hypothetical protein